MVEYICDKCNKKFNLKDSYKKHMNRKNTCAPNSGRLDTMEERIQNLEKEIIELKNIIKNLQKID